MKYFLVAIRVFSVLIVTAFLILGLWIHGLIRGRSLKLGFYYRRLWARSSAYISGIRIDEINLRKVPDNALYVSNHRSLTDPVVQLAYFDAFIIAKNEVSYIPVIGKGAEMTGIIFVKRGKLSSRAKAHNETAELLSDGKNVLVYPEGTTTVGRDTGLFKRGTFKAAAELNKPVVPIALEYRDHKDYWWEESMRTQLIQQLGHWNTHVKMSVGEPIYSSDPYELVNRSREWIDAELKRLRKDWSEVHPHDDAYIQT